MIECTHKGKYTNIHINELYNIINVYNKSFNKNKHNHESCLCNQCFTNNLQIDDFTTSDKELERYICCHFEKICIITNNYKQFCTLYPNVSWLINQNVNFNGNTADFCISKRFQLIGYDKNNVIIAYVKPQFNEINYNDTLMDSVFDTYLVKNVDKESENYNKMHGKNVSCVVFTTDLDVPYYINWLNANKEDMLDKNHELIQNIIIKANVTAKYLQESTMVYNFYKYWRKHCPEDVIKPLDIINYIIKEFNKVKSKNRMVSSFGRDKNLPNFIAELFNDIKFKIKYSTDKKNQSVILKYYDNKANFMTCLEQQITNAIDLYFGFKMKNIVEECSDSDSEIDTGYISE